MKHWNPNQKPPLDECPEHYCFFWIPPGGSADLSGKLYDSLKDVVEASRKGVVFIKGGCSAASFGVCKRESKKCTDRDLYEPCEPLLKKSGLPEIFFCNPSLLDDDSKAQYESMAKLFWGEA